MLISSLSGARRSVTPADLEKYMKYKRDMERKLGMDEMANAAPVVGLDSEVRPGAGAGAAGATGGAPAARNFGTVAADDDDDDDDDIYGD